ncbi:MAG TPA: TrmO family methyltransferase [Chitinispirillaceae bacterium]|nr:TrmO family methyltransferase [Chitinispirillaceae bacterium]
MDTEQHGIFACKAQKRPNAIGISTVRLIAIHNNIIDVEQIDMLDSTPLIDIKPFYPCYDNRGRMSLSDGLKKRQAT